MGQNKNKNFIAARLPQELYNRFDSVTGDEKGEKTRFIIKAIAAYLDFPLKSSDTAEDNNEKFVALESRIAELEQQFQEFKFSVINSNLADNNMELSVIASDKSFDNTIQPSITVDKKNTLVIQSDGSIGPAPESQIADFMAISNRALGYHRKKLEKTGKPLNQPKKVEYNNQPYDLICQGASKIRGKTIFIWIAKPVIETDNSIYQPDIIEYQVDNNLTDAPQALNQEEHEQNLESAKLSDNDSYQQLSAKPNTSKESDRENSQSSQPIDNTNYQSLSIESNISQKQEKNEQDSETLDSFDNTSYQKLSGQSDTNQEEDNQNSQVLKPADNSNYQSLSMQSDFNEEINKQQQDSDNQSTKEHQAEKQQPKLAEEQPEF
jgi:metal-responsive CopG/Arc/MetJ family transcriptional regulator